MTPCPCCRRPVAECMAGGVSLSAVIEASAAAWGCTADELRSGARSQYLDKARRLAMALCRELIDVPAAIIGEAMKRTADTVRGSCIALSRKPDGDRERRVYGALLERFRKGEV